MKSKLIAILLILKTVQILCQSPIFTEVDNDHYFTAKCLAQDQYGFIWVGTDQGIFKYNGFEFLKIETQKSYSITSLSSWKNQMIAGTSNGDLLVWPCTSQKSEQSFHLSNKPISDIEFTTNGTAFVATYGEGLFLFEGKTFQKIQRVGSSEIYDIQFLSLSGELAIATDNGIELLKDGKIKQLQNLPDHIIIKLCVDSQNKLFAATYNGSIFHYDIHSNKSTVIFDNQNKEKNQQILKYNDRILALVGNSLYELKDKNILKYNIDSEIKINQMMVDNENNLWVISGKNRLYRSNLNFLKFNITEEIIQTTLFAKGNFYFGTPNGIFITKDIGSKANKQILAKENITKLKANGNKLLIGTYSNGLFIYDLITQKIGSLGKLEDIHNNTVLDFEWINDHTIEIATLAGVKQLTFGESTEMRENKKNILQAYVYDIFIDAKGTRWYGKDKGGLSMINIRNEKHDIEKIYDFPTKQYAKIGSVYSIVYDRNSDAHFIATSEAGVIKYQLGKWQAIPETKDVVDPPISLILTSDDQIIIVYSLKVKIYDLKDGHMLPYTMDKSKGFKSSFYNNFTSKANEHFFVQKNNLFRIIEHQIVKKHPLTQIDKININLKEWDGKTRSFPQSENNFQFHFTASWLLDPSMLKYTYKIDGIDKDWRITQDRFASYPKLRPGQYVFRVKASENNTFINESESTFQFKIKKAYYNTWWFYTLVAILVGMLFYLQQKRKRNFDLIKSELSRKKVEAELVNLKRQLDPHFLFNTMNTLIGLIEEDPKKGISYTETLTDFLRHLTQLGNKELNSIVEEIEITQLYKEILYHRFGKNLIIEIQPGLCSLEGMVPPLSIQMLIENAVKHNEVSRANPLIIYIERDGDFVCVRNKKNLKLSKPPSLGVGNHNIIERYKLMNKPSPLIIENEAEYIFKLPIIKL